MTTRLICLIGLTMRFVLLQRWKRSWTKYPTCPSSVQGRFTMAIKHCPMPPTLMWKLSTLVLMTCLNLFRNAPTFQTSSSTSTRPAPLVLIQSCMPRRIASSVIFSRHAKGSGHQTLPVLLLLRRLLLLEQHGQHRRPHFLRPPAPLSLGWRHRGNWHDDGLRRDRGH